MDIEKSHGSWLYDKLTEREYLDMFSMFASASMGTIILIFWKDQNGWEEWLLTSQLG
jgi:acetylornithine/succinyldiaminopimelate/putrescine aminotransferase